MKRTLLATLATALSVSCLPSCVVASAAAAASKGSIWGALDYRYFVAGGTCAAISHGITTPIDVIKTRMQACPEKYNKGLLHATTSILKEEGPSALSSGLGPTILGYGIEGAAKFGIYEVTKPLAVQMFENLRKKPASGPLPFIVASAAAGAVASLILVPMESARIRMVTDDKFDGVGIFEALSILVKESGLFNVLTAGLVAMLAKQVPYTFGKQVSFDVVAKFLYKVLNSPRNVVDGVGSTLSDTVASILGKDSVKWVVSVLSAMVASIMACLLSQPGDVILTETYKGSEKKQNIREVSAGVYARHGDKGVIKGFSGFFTGTQARILHVGLIITSQLVIYDLVKQMLGLPATGSH